MTCSIFKSQNENIEHQKPKVQQTKADFPPQEFNDKKIPHNIELDFESGLKNKGTFGISKDREVELLKKLEEERIAFADKEKNLDVHINNYILYTKEIPKRIQEAAAELARMENDPSRKSQSVSWYSSPEKSICKNIRNLQLSQQNYNALAHEKLLVFNKIELEKERAA